MDPPEAHVSPYIYKPYSVLITYVRPVIDGMAGKTELVKLLFGLPSKEYRPCQHAYRQVLCLILDGQICDCTTAYMAIKVRKPCTITLFHRLIGVQYATHVCVKNLGVKNFRLMSRLSLRIYS